MKLLSNFFGKANRKLEHAERLNEMMRSEIKNLHVKMTQQLGDNQELKAIYEYTVFNLEEKIKALESILKEKEKEIAKFSDSLEAKTCENEDEVIEAYDNIVEIKAKKPVGRPKKSKSEGLA